jgi:hypothetical protein
VVEVLAVVVYGGPSAALVSYGFQVAPDLRWLSNSYRASHFDFVAVEHQHVGPFFEYVVACHLSFPFALGQG